MARHHLLRTLSGAELSLDEVWDWYEYQTSLINAELDRTLDATLSGAVPTEARYFGKSREELVEFFAWQREELNNAAMLTLLAATKAAVRVDYIDRVGNKRKDALSKGFAQLYEQSKRNVSLEDQILDLWKQHSSRAVNEAIGQFNGALNLRHWLVHGRYWRPQFGQNYDTRDVFDICSALLKAVAAG